MFELSSAPVLETARLRLRVLKEGDLDPFAAMSADPDVMRYVGATGQPVDRRGAWRILAIMVGHWAFRGYGFFAMEDKATGAFVGRTGLWQPEGWPGLEIAWAVARERWGEGLATEAAIAMRDHAFGTMNVPRLISLIRPGNKASIRVAEKIGERFDRRMDLDGEALVYAIDNPAGTI
jgi:[ribosomal protein S5]-alanine N-acetyltransferase